MVYDRYHDLDNKANCSKGNRTDSMDTCFLLDGTFANFCDPTAMHDWQDLVSTDSGHAMSFLHQWTMLLYQCMSF